MRVQLAWCVATLSLALASSITCVSQSDFGHSFALLPPEKHWRRIVRDASAREITALVHDYIQPYAEYQRAARDMSIAPAKLKDALVLATDLLYESSRNLVILEEEFEESKREIDVLLDVATAVFRLERAKRLLPVFTPATIEAFSRRRLRSLLFDQAGYLKFLVRKYNYETTVKEWHVVASRLPQSRYRALLPRNLDMHYVSRMTAVYLDVMRLQEERRTDKKPAFGQRLKLRFHKDEWIGRIEALGNGLSVSKPPYSLFMIAVTVMYAVLVSVV